MLQREDFKTRIDNQQSIRAHEIQYPIMQGWDSVMVKADVELGGTDQLFNILIGRDFQKEEGLPQQVVFLLPILEGLDGSKKMSKSLGNFIDLEKIDRYVANYGLDAFRYFLARYGPLGINDSDFAEARFNEVYIAELADKMGNLVNRTLTMIQRYRDGTVPASGAADLRTEAEQMIAAYRERMDRLDFTAALETLWGFVIRANQYVEESAPWKLAKDPATASRLDGVLYNLAESARLISVLVTPFMPAIAAQIRTQLGVCEELTALTEEVRWGGLPAGTKLGQVAPLFPKRA
jgi:methionyl-tRNA synthetase